MFATDGKISSVNTGQFISNKEKHPWLEIPFTSPLRIAGIVLISRGDVDRKKLKKVEIRAGMNAASGTGKLLKHNRKVGFYEGPAGQKETIKIMFDKPLTAKYVSIQLTYTDAQAMLEINEATPIKGNKFGNLKLRLTLTC